MQPHSRYPHLFVVLRVDEWDTEPVEDRISAVSAYRSQAAAAAEAERLNRLKHDKRCHYSVLPTRLKDR